MWVKFFVNRILRKNGKVDFISRLPDNATILDVGCGNNSPFHVKSLKPHSKYTGIDVGVYNQNIGNPADSYIITTPEKFAKRVAEFKGAFDAVISAHNIEHCNEPGQTLDAMIGAIRPGGKIFLSFPCADSVNFPSRLGTLNFYDDETHRGQPPEFDKIIHSLTQGNFQILYAKRNFRPLFFAVCGFLMEPLSRFRKKVLRGTWEYYGFESIIIAQKI